MLLSFDQDTITMPRYVFLMFGIPIGVAAGYIAWKLKRKR